MHLLKGNPYVRGCSYANLHAYRSTSKCMHMYICLWNSFIFWIPSDMTNDMVISYLLIRNGIHMGKKKTKNTPFGIQISLQSRVLFKFLNSWIPATQANSHQLWLWVFSVFLLSHQVEFSFSFSFYYQTKNLKNFTLTAFVQLSKQQGMQ